MLDYWIPLVPTLTQKGNRVQAAIHHLDSGTELLYYKQSFIANFFTRFEFKVVQLTTQNSKRRKAWTTKKR